MTIHKFCKEVYAGVYFTMGSTISDEMLGIIQEETELDWADARDKQLEVLNELEIETLNDDMFLAGEHAISYDYDTVTDVSDWVEGQGHCLSISCEEWSSFDIEVNDVLKYILLENKLITENEWEKINSEFYSLLMDGEATNITSREIGNINIDLSELYLMNYELEGIISEVLSGSSFSNWKLNVSNSNYE